MLIPCGKVAANNRSINSNLQTINIIKDLKTEIYSAESIQRGYLLTADKEYLEPYHNTLVIIDDLLDKLDGATKKFPEQAHACQ